MNRIIIAVSLLASVSVLAEDRVPAAAKPDAPVPAETIKPTAPVKHSPAKKELMNAKLIPVDDKTGAPKVTPPAPTVSPAVSGPHALWCDRCKEMNYVMAIMPGTCQECKVDTSGSPPKKFCPTCAAKANVCPVCGKKK